MHFNLCANYLNDLPFLTNPCHSFFTSNQGVYLKNEKVESIPQHLRKIRNMKIIKI